MRAHKQDLPPHSVETGKSALCRVQAVESESAKVQDVEASKAAVKERGLFQGACYFGCSKGI